MIAFPESIAPIALLRAATPQLRSARCVLRALRKLRQSLGDDIAVVRSSSWKDSPPPLQLQRPTAKMTSTPLTATYQSPTAAQNFSVELPQQPKSDSVDKKTTYLGSLRASASKLQGEINAFLTQKMDEDTAVEAGKNGSAQKTNEDREEDMYGEEDPETA